MPPPRDILPHTGAKRLDGKRITAFPPPIRVLQKYSDSDEPFLIPIARYPLKPVRCIATVPRKEEVYEKPTA
jgi:hypothetical protein